MPACACNVAALAALLLSSALGCTMAIAGTAGQAEAGAVIAPQMAGKLSS